MKSEHLWLAPAALLYFLLGRAGMALLSLEPDNLTLLWLPSGVGVVMWQRAQWRAFPWIFAASFLANLDGMMLGDLPQTLMHVGFGALADSLMPWIAVLMLQRYLPDGLHTVKGLFPFVLYVCLFPAAVAAVAIVLNLVAGGYIEWSEAPLTARMLLLSDSLGVLLVYPIYHAFRTPAWPGAFDFAWTLIPGVLLLEVIYLAFSSMPGLIHLLTPFFLYLALSDRNREMLALLLLVVVTMLYKSTGGLGPFAVASPSEALFLLMTFIFVLTLIALSLMLHKQELQSSVTSRDLWRRRAGIDELTGLSNRYIFMPILEAELGRTLRHRRPFSLAMLDIDHFKHINDSRGHMLGDKVLKALAQFMQNEMRTIDVLCRFGGEEFCILLPETSLNFAAYAMERLRERLESDGLDVDGERMRVTVSIGLVSFDGGDETQEALLKRADQLLYAAKHAGRNMLMTEAPAVGELGNVAS
ncbi:MAG: diguanylate cyclase [Gammaproteobacteria bacterium]